MIPGDNNLGSCKAARLIENGVFEVGNLAPEGFFQNSPVDRRNLEQGQQLPQGVPGIRAGQGLREEVINRRDVRASKNSPTLCETDLPRRLASVLADRTSSAFMRKVSLVCMTYKRHQTIRLVNSTFGREVAVMRTPGQMRGTVPRGSIL